MIKLSEKSMSKAEIDWKLLCRTFNQVVSAKEKFLKEIKVLLHWTHKYMIRKQNGVNIDKDKVLVYGKKIRLATTFL